MIARLLISKTLEKRTDEIEKILSQAGLSEKHVDVLYFSSDSKLGIEQARKIKEHFSLKPYSSKGRAVVMEDAASLTPEAQNALLKTLEEPPLDAILILGASSEAKFLPTILSRCQIVNLSSSVIPSGPARSADGSPVDSQSEGSPDSKSIEQLLNSSIAERFEFIEKLKDREDFLYALIQYFRQNPDFHFLKELLQAEEWANQNVNIRAILEYLMLVMPSKEW